MIIRNLAAVVAVSATVVLPGCAIWGGPDRNDEARLGSDGQMYAVDASGHQYAVSPAQTATNLPPNYNPPRPLTYR